MNFIITLLHNNFVEEEPVICTLGGRFPWARTEPPREDHSAGSQRLRFSTGVATRRSNHLILLPFYLYSTNFFINYSTFPGK